MSDKAEKIETTVQIDGMACGMCEAHVSDALRAKLPGYKISASHSRGTATPHRTRTPCAPHSTARATACWGSRAHRIGGAGCSVLAVRAEIGGGACAFLRKRHF